jgi:hypothetical protein
MLIVSFSNNGCGWYRGSLDGGEDRPPLARRLAAALDRAQRVLDQASLAEQDELIDWLIREDER